MFQKIVTFSYDWLISIMTAIDQSIPSLYLKIPILYGFLLICWTILLVSYDGLIIRTLSKSLEFLYKLCRVNKNVSVIRVLSEWYYLFDKLFYFSSPHVISYGYQSDNVLDKSQIFSPIFLYRTLKFFIYSMFVFSIGNIIRWGMMLSYFYPTLFLKVKRFVTNLKWVEVSSTLTQIEYKKINDFVSFASIILSISVILWLTSSAFKWKAMRKFKEEKYEKAIKHQEQIEDLLGTISYCSKENIHKLNQMIKYLPDMFGQLITNMDKYRLEKDALKSHDFRSYSDTKLEDMTRGYESFQEQLNKINEILKEIRQSRLRYVYSRINKSVRYETLQLGLFYKTHIDSYLIEEYDFKESIENRLRNLSRLTDEFTQIKEVWSGWLTKEVLEEQHNKYGGSFTFEKIVKYAEHELEEEMIKFKRFLHRKLEDAILHHIILEEYLEISRNNTQFNLLKMILSLLGPK